MEEYEYWVSEEATGADRISKLRRRNAWLMAAAAVLLVVFGFALGRLSG